MGWTPPSCGTSSNRSSPQRTWAKGRDWGSPPSEKPFDPKSLLATVQAAVQASGEVYDHDTNRLEVRQRFTTLTPRERALLKLVIEGRSNKQIAFDLGICAKTVANIRAKLMQKTGFERPRPRAIEHDRRSDRARAVQIPIANGPQHMHDEETQRRCCCRSANARASVFRRAGEEIDLDVRHNGKELSSARRANMRGGALLPEDFRQTELRSEPRGSSSRIVDILSCKAQRDWRFVTAQLTDCSLHGAWRWCSPTR